MASEFHQLWRKASKLLQELSDQGVTNLRQLIQWLRSVDVTEAIIAYLRAHPGLQGIIYWVAAIAVGLIAVAYAWVFGEATQFAQMLSVQSPWPLLFLSPLAFLTSRWLVYRFAPGAAGSGIPQVMAGLEVDAQQAATWVSARVAIVMVLSSLACAMGGGAIGREGPTIQIAACVFYILGMRFKHIWPSINHQSLLVAGGSAGIAAAFNTPLGGIVFAVEELSQQHFNRFKTFLISAVIIAGLVAQWILGPYLYLGFPKLANITSYCFPWAIFVGIACGLAGATFAKILWMVQSRLAVVSMKTQWKLVFIIGVVVGLSGWFLGSEVLGSGNEMITRILFDENHEVRWVVVIGRFFGPLISYTAGVTGGIFAPALSAGAAIGAKMSELFSSSWPNLSVLLGMASFLSGFTRAPFTAFVLVLEMTDRHSAIFPLMMASLAASLAAKLLDSQSFYERKCAALVKAIVPSAGSGAGIEPAVHPHSPGLPQG